MAKAIGLDIGTHSVKLIEIEGSPKKFKVTRFVSREIPGGASAESEAISATIGEVLREGRAQKDGVVAAMGSGAVVIREIMVPFLQDDQIRRVLRFEAEAHLHSYAIEDVVVDHVKIGEVKDQSRILIFAAPKERVRERLDLIQGNGADPMHLDLDMTALFNAAAATGAFEEHPNCVILDIGAGTTLMLFVQDGELKSCRSLRTGAESLSRAISEDLAVDTDAARARAREGDRTSREDDLLAPIPLDDDEETLERDKTADELEHSIVVQRQDDFLARIHRETSRSLASYPSGAGLEAIYVTGAASLAAGIRRSLEERFRKPVLPLRLLSEDCRAISAADYEQANACAGVALGCALRLLGFEGTSVELRRDELRYMRKFDLIKVSLASAVSMVFILLFLIWLHYQNALKIRRVEHTDVSSTLDSTYVADTTRDYKTVLKDNAKDLRRLPADPTAWLAAANSNITKMYRHITAEMGFDVAGIRPIRSTLEVWRELFERLGEEKLRAQLGYLFIDDIRITQESLVIEGRIGNRGNIDLIAVEVAKMKDVEKVDRGDTSTDEQGKTKFRHTASLRRTVPERTR